MVLIGIIWKGCGLESKHVSFFTDMEFKIAQYHIIGSLPLAKNVLHCTSKVLWIRLGSHYSLLWNQYAYYQCGSHSGIDEVVEKLKVTVYSCEIRAA